METTQNANPIRRIVVLVPTATNIPEIERIEAYLYGNFEVTDQRRESMLDDHYTEVTISGRDSAGFTAEAQADRLWSGMIGARVVA